jgi:hypothetical protein
MCQEGTTNTCTASKECDDIIHKVGRVPGKFETVGTSIGSLVDEKNTAYGNAVNKLSDLLTSFYPDGIKPVHYKSLGVIVRILDKLRRIANNPSGDNKDNWNDIAGYSILMLGSDK